MLGKKSAGSYEANDPNKNSEELSRRLAQDLRRHIHSLAAFSIFSKDWFGMCESLQHIASIALMEERDTEDEEHSTLWEREELSVRFMLEEGKLNLSLRNMKDYKAFQQNLDSEPTFRKAIFGKLKQEPIVIEARMSLFEHSLGLLLKCSFQAVEALQTIDMPMLIEHCSLVLDNAVKHPALMNKDSDDVNRSQEVLVVYYLLSVFRNIDDLQEDRIMEIVEEGAAVHNLLAVLHAHYHTFSRDALLAAAELLSLVVDTETFRTHPEKFVKDDDDRRMVVGLAGLFVAGLVAANPDFKRRIRALLDRMDADARAMGVDLPDM